MSDASGTTESSIVSFIQYMTDREEGNERKTKNSSKEKSVRKSEEKKNERRGDSRWSFCKGNYPRSLLNSMELRPSRDPEESTAIEIDDWAERRDAYSERAKALAKLKRLDATDDLDYYLEWFEEVMEDGGINESEYCDHL